MCPIEPTGRPEGTPVFEEELATPAAEQQAPQEPMLDLPDGRKIAQRDAVEAYANMAKWRQQNAERGRQLNEQEQQIRQWQERYGYIADVDKYFREHPDEEEAFAGMVREKLGRTVATQPTAPVAPGQPVSDPERAAMQKKIEALEKWKNDYELSQEVTRTWSDFRQRHPDCTPMQELAMRGALGILQTESLDDAYRYVTGLSKPEQQGMAADTQRIQRERSLATGTLGTGPSGSGQQPFDHSSHSMEECEKAAHDALMRGDYAGK